MFEGFTLERVDAGDAELRVRYGGPGPPVLLLHGHPRTHVTWHKVAPVLAEQFTVVCPDLRGYGESSKPPATPDHSPYAKRAIIISARGSQRCMARPSSALGGPPCWVPASQGLVVCRVARHASSPSGT